MITELKDIPAENIKQALIDNDLGNIIANLSDLSNSTHTFISLLNTEFSEQMKELPEAMYIVSRFTKFNTQLLNC